MKKAKQQHKHTFVPKDLLAKYTRLLDEAAARVMRNVENKVIDYRVERFIEREHPEMMQYIKR